MPSPEDLRFEPKCVSGSNLYLSTTSGCFLFTKMPKRKVEHGIILNDSSHFVKTKGRWQKSANLTTALVFSLSNEVLKITQILKNYTCYFSILYFLLAALGLKKLRGKYKDFSYNPCPHHVHSLAPAITALTRMVRCLPRINLH